MRAGKGGRSETAVGSFQSCRHESHPRGCRVSRNFLFFYHAVLCLHMCICWLWFFVHFIDVIEDRSKMRILGWKMRILGWKMRILGCKMRILGWKMRILGWKMRILFARAAARNLQDEHHYLFLKQLCQVLTEIGRQLCNLWVSSACVLSYFYSIKWPKHVCSQMSNGNLSLNAAGLFLVLCSTSSKQIGPS
jgi:hypothetical protein